MKYVDFRVKAMYGEYVKLMEFEGTAPNGSNTVVEGRRWKSPLTNAEFIDIRINGQLYNGIPDDEESYNKEMEYIIEKFKKRNYSITLKIDGVTNTKFDMKMTELEHKNLQEFLQRHRDQILSIFNYRSIVTSWVEYTVPKSVNKDMRG